MYSHSCIIRSESINRKHDFYEPDFGVKASLKLASKKRNKCNLQTEADSEIPYLGLDSGRLNIDCDINPVRLANAAAKVARSYGKYRQERKKKRNQSPRQSSSTMKRKRTRISLDTDYEKTKQHHDADSENDDDDDDSGNKQSNEDDS